MLWDSGIHSSFEIDWKFLSAQNSHLDMFLWIISGFQIAKHDLSFNAAYLWELSCQDMLHIESLDIIDHRNPNLLINIDFRQCFPEHPFNDFVL